MSVELYKKHRPRTLKRVVGNRETVRTLSALIKNERLPHTLLFHGPSGCGKTTLARILKTELNCGDRDFNEVNCADFRGIDTVRDIMRNMGLSAIQGEARIWLIDECHKLSNDAQNAFLKALEDTPKHVWFFLCTTEPEKLLSTIRTRCCDFRVDLLTDEEMIGLLKSVLRREKREVDETVLDIISFMSLGSPRMGLVLLDKVLDLPAEEQAAAVQEFAAKQNEAIHLCRILLKRTRNWKEVAGIVKNLKDDPESVRWAVLGYMRSTLLSAAGKNAEGAWWVIECFSEPFYNTKAAGLAAAAYRAVTDGP